ncbi:uncharacterized protein LOC129295630 [Prosopis cineraria]|uniref:uncharacterized protein LOC129295630 n=1 Tax=Prosopis cineraria TaxID=364024 RepID=UPI00240F2E4F|nr:uncharacterized protein LOC129295630 [Prosopis cineraria]
MLQLLLFYKNQILHLSLAATLAFFLTFFKIPILFLYGIHSYIHPDNFTQNNGFRAAIRRPGTSSAASGPEGYQSLSSKTSAELRKRNKSKEKIDFDENKAQIFRLKLDQGHLQSRLFADQYGIAFTVSITAIACLLLRTFLGVAENSGFLESGVFVPILLTIVGLGIWFLLLMKITFEKSASRRSEKQLSVVFGVSGFFIGLLGFSSNVFPGLDFDFSPVDGHGRLCIAALMGFLSAVLFIPASRSARSFWLGTDQLRCSLSMITCGWFTRTILYASHILIIFVTLLWISPLAELFVYTDCSEGERPNAMSKVGSADKLVGYMGLFRSDFNNLRRWCLLVSSLLQILALRPSLQMYLNEALLSWYQRLHASKIPELDYSRAKVFLHNHYLCLVASQFLAPPVLVLLFLGLSQIDEHAFESFPLLLSILPSSAFIKELALFMGWWVTCLWAIFSSVILLLHRHCILYIS